MRLGRLMIRLARRMICRRMGFCLRWRGRGKGDSVEADKGEGGRGFDLRGGGVCAVGCGDWGLESREWGCEVGSEAGN